MIRVDPGVLVGGAIILASLALLFVRERPVLYIGPSR